MEKQYKKELLKVIAIRPLEDCEQYILKRLHKGKTYFFYNNYKIKETEQDPAKEEKERMCYFDESAEELPADFFSISNLNHRPIISVSALVGKNGDGKSSLIELFIRIINNLACHILSGENEDFIQAQGVHAELYFSLETYQIAKKRITRRQFFKLEVKNEQIKLYTDYGNSVIHNGTVTDITSQLKKEHLSELFYSIVVNYSIYANNVMDFQQEWEDQDDYSSCWMHSLFHKNDGYTCPIVLHPFRDRGIININTENYLTKNRLISLYLQPVKDKKFNFRQVTDTQIAHRLTYTLAVNKKFENIKEEWDKWEKTQSKKMPHSQFNNTITFNELYDEIIKNWYAIFQIKVTKPELPSEKLNIYQKAEQYLVYKTISISKKYKRYKDTLCLMPDSIGNYGQEFWNDLKPFIQNMAKDHSHITLKLRQTIIFLKYYYNAWNSEIRKFILADGDTEILDDLNKMIEEFKKEFWHFRETNLLPQYKDFPIWDYMDFLPSPIFNVEIGLQIVNSNEIEKFEKLSSGEKQLIYNVSSILYHIRNINSVFENPNTGIVKYKHLNLILEEVELYFHPEFQRRYVNYLLNCINSINLQHIESINICFVTHSPFILSDIPQSNILFLQEGLPYFFDEENNTFACNIHSMFTNQFFLQNHVMGEFAQQLITKEIAPLLRGEEIDKERLETIIKLIGEPVLRAKLLDMLNDK